MKIGSFEIPALYVLLIFVPVSLTLEFTHGNPVMLFATAALAIVPLAGIMGKATEHLASTMGAAVGGLLNATFGNAAEMIIAIVALRAGLHDVVKASLTGSIIGNVLLVLGLAIVMGGVRHEQQHFNKTAAGLGTTLLALSATGLVIPAVFAMVAGPEGSGRVQSMSLGIAAVLFVTYLLSLWFQLRTHRRLFETAGGHGQNEGPVWSRKKAAIVLLAATAFVALESEMLVGSIEHAAASMGMTNIFVGVILVAIIGNAAEHSTAVLVAMKNKMDLCMNIAIGSSIQIALFVAPVLLFLSYAIGPQPMDLVFVPFEVIAVGISVGIVALVAHDGESHWMEGVLLLAVYAILGIAFFFLPVATGGGH